MKKEITKKEFLKYEKIRQSGRYNMITEWVQASTEAGLSKEKYRKIVSQYSILRDKYST